MCHLTHLASLSENTGFSELIMQYMFLNAMILIDQISLQMSLVRRETCAMAGAPAGLEMGEQSEGKRIL